jgi:hypothetical protein
MLKIDIDRAALSPSLIYRLFASMFIPFAYIFFYLKNDMVFWQKSQSQNRDIKQIVRYGTLIPTVPAVISYHIVRKFPSEPFA